MKVIISERSVTLWAFPLSRVIPGLQTFKTEHVKAFGQDGVLLTCITTRTRQLGLKKKKGNKINRKTVGQKSNNFIRCISPPLYWQTPQHANTNDCL